MNRTERDDLIHQVQYGLMRPEEAEAEAARLGLGPLASKPARKQHNPMEETWWTLPMAVAWIVWRNPDDVLDCYDPYREQCWYWNYEEWRVGPDGPVYKGHFLKQRPLATLALLSLSARYDVATASQRDCFMRVSDAVAQLWKALLENSLQGIGRLRYGEHRQPIADCEWLDLKPIEENGRDFLTRDPLSHGGYYDVAFRRQSIIALWPGRQTSEPSLRLPKTMRPDGPGFFPLYCAVQWIATCGDIRDFEPTDAAIWDAAYRELNARIASGHVAVTGIRNGIRERIDGHVFASLRVDQPFLDTPLDLILSDDLYLSSSPYIDEHNWLGGFDDNLQSRAGIKWAKLMVLKSDIAGLWPFSTATGTQADASTIRTGAPGRPTPMHLVVAEHHARLADGRAETSVVAESEWLADWLSKTHPTLPALKPKSIRNKIAVTHRSATVRPK